jgi:N-glycosylase/DNA lyase
MAYLKEILDSHKDKLSEIQKRLKGFQASHVLRNIGFGDALAILDVHILRSLVKYGIIPKVPKSLTKNRYLSIEEKVDDFSRKVKIPMAHLDLV